MSAAPLIVEVVGSMNGVSQQHKMGVSLLLAACRVLEAVHVENDFREVQPHTL